MQAGQTLDELIALDVMEWTPHGQGFWIEDPQERDLSEFCPSSNIAHAWEVVGKMRGLGYEFALLADEQRTQVLTYAAEFDKYNGNIGETTYIRGERADTAPLAICLAALSALGVSINA